MATFDIMVLPGDGIGPEVTGASQQVLDAVADALESQLPLPDRRGRRRRDRRLRHTPARRDRPCCEALERGALRRGRRPQVGQRARPPGGRYPRPAQGARPLRQHPPGQGLPRHGAREPAQGRPCAGRGHGHPARTHRRPLLRPAQEALGDEGRTQGRRHAPLHREGDRAHPARRLRARTLPPQEAHLRRQGERPPVIPPLARDSRRGLEGLPGRRARAPVGRLLRDGPHHTPHQLRRHGHGKHVRRYHLGRGRRPLRLARHAAVRQPRRAPRQGRERQDA